MPSGRQAGGAGKQWHTAAGPLRIRTGFPGSEGASGCRGAAPWGSLSLASCFAVVLILRLFFVQHEMKKLHQCVVVVAMQQFPAMQRIVHTLWNRPLRRVLRWITRRAAPLRREKPALGATFCAAARAGGRVDKQTGRGRPCPKGPGRTRGRSGRAGLIGVRAAQGLPRTQEADAAKGAEGAGETCPRTPQGRAPGRIAPRRGPGGPALGAAAPGAAGTAAAKSPGRAVNFQGRTAGLRRL